MLALKCLTHQQKNIIGFCVQKECLEQRSCCLKCLQEFHVDHPKEIIELDDYNSWIQPTTDLLPKILEQINDIEYVTQIIKITFQNFTKCFAPDKLTTFNLNQIIQTALKIDQQKNKFLEVIGSLHDFCRSIFPLIQKRQQNQYDQGEQLIKLKKWEETLKFLAQQNNDVEKALSTSLQTIETTFNCFGFEQYFFFKQLTPPHIKIANYNTAIQTQRSPQRYAFIYPSISIKFQTKIKFKILQYEGWISIGICKIETAKKSNHQYQDLNQLGHGFYMISSNQSSWSHHDQQTNLKAISNFRMQAGDMIILVIDNKQGQLTWINENSNQSYSMRYNVDPEMYGCVGLDGFGDSIQLINQQYMIQIQ